MNDSRRTHAEIAALPTPRQARIAAGFGGAEGLARLGKIVRRAPATILAYERGTLPPDMIIRRLCKALGCSYDCYFFTSRELPSEALSAGDQDSGRPARRRRTSARRRGGRVATVPSQPTPPRTGAA